MLPSPCSDDTSKCQCWIPADNTAHSIQRIQFGNPRFEQEIYCEISQPTSRWIVSMLKEGYKVQSAVTAKQGLIFSTVPGKRVAEVSVENRIYVYCLFQQIGIWNKNLLTAQECTNQMFCFPGVTMQRLYSVFEVMLLHTDDASWVTQGMHLLVAF